MHTCIFYSYIYVCVLSVIISQITYIHIYTHISHTYIYIAYIHTHIYITNWSSYSTHGQNTDFKAKLRYKWRIVQWNSLKNMGKKYFQGENSVLPVANSSWSDFKVLWGFFLGFFLFFSTRSWIASFWTLAITAAGALISPPHYNYH